MAELEEFFKNIFPDLKEYKERLKEHFLFISFLCGYGKMNFTISNKDNHIYDLYFLDFPIVINIERQLKIHSLNQQFAEYQKIKKEGS